MATESPSEKKYRIRHTGSFTLKQTRFRDFPFGYGHYSDELRFWKEAHTLSDNGMIELQLRPSPMDMWRCDDVDYDEDRMDEDDSDDESNDYDMMKDCKMSFGLEVKRQDRPVMPVKFSICLIGTDGIKRCFTGQCFCQFFPCSKNLKIYFLLILPFI